MVKGQVFSVQLFIGLSLLVMLAGCFHNGTVFKAERIDYDGEQKPATILVSDPQVFSRETLINDRREEEEYLTALLQESRDIQFTPALKRELNDIATLSAQLGLSFNPSMATAAGATMDLNALRQQIAAKQLEIELAKQQKMLESVENATPPEITLDAGNAASTVPTMTVPDAPSLDGVNAALTALRARVDALYGKASALQDKEVKKARTADVVASPREVFRDREAYRAELRSALNAVRLDDGHDYAGNALYRLQFDVTVLPYEPDSKQWGGLQAITTPPKFSKNQVKAFYRNWLSYLNEKANYLSQDEAGKISTYRNQNIIELVELTGMADFIPFYVDQIDRGEKNYLCPGLSSEKAEAEKCNQFYIAFEKGNAAKVKALFENAALCLYVEHKGKVGNNNSKPDLSKYVSMTDATLDKNKCVNKEMSRNQKIETVNKKLTEDAKNIVEENLPVFKRQLVVGLEDIKVILNREFSENPGFVRQVQSLINLISEAEGIIAAQGSLTNKNPLSQYVVPSYSDCTYRDTYFLEASLFRGHGETGAFRVSPRGDEAEALPGWYFSFVCMVYGFQPNVDRYSFDSDETGLLAPQISVYDVAPIELAQTSSTVAGRARSFESALALAGALPQVGANVETSLGYMRSVAGRAETLERLPLVIGFSQGAEPPSKQINRGVAQTEVSGSHFGWLFGPQMSLDVAGNRIQLRHEPKRYDVFVDLAVPAWWPYLELDFETAWMQNWDQDTHGRFFKPPESPEIDCRDEQTSNRGNSTAEGYANKPLDEVAIGALNDVAIEALRKCPERRKKRVPMPVNRDAYYSLTEYIVRTLGHTVPSVAVIEKMRPKTIAACSNGQTINIEGPNLWRNPQVYLNGSKATQVRVLPDMRGISATFSGDVIRNVVDALHVPSDNKIRTVELSVATRNGITSEEIQVLRRENCRVS